MHPEEHDSLSQQLLADEKVRQLIAVLAYQKYVGRGRADGHDRQDWREAESEVLADLIARQTISQRSRPQRAKVASANEAKSVRGKKIEARNASASSPKPVRKATAKKGPPAKVKSGAASIPTPSPVELKEATDKGSCLRKRAVATPRGPRKAEDPSSVRQ